MQTGLNLKQLSERLIKDREAAKDYVIDTRKMAMHARESDEKSTSGGYAIKPTLELYGTSDELPIRPLVHDQIGARLEIPGKYYDRMLRDQPQLLVANVNAWFAHKPELRMVRTMEGSARAFLSNRYQRVDNWQVAEAALPILGRIPGVQIKSCQVTETRLYIQAVSPRVQGEVRKNDVVQAGVVISNSEVGAGSVSVSAMVWRLVCLNGMITGDRFRAYHVGRKVEEEGAMWSDRTRRIDDSLILSKVQDMVNSAIDANMFESRLNKMRALTGETMARGADPAKAVEVLAKKIGASDEERGGILRALIEGKDLSAWGFLNAVTNQAHGSRSYDRSVEMEAAGGMLLDLPRSDWRQVLEAA